MESEIAELKAQLQQARKHARDYYIIMGYALEDEDPRAYDDTSAAHKFWVSEVRRLDREITDLEAANVLS